MGDNIRFTLDANRRVLDALNPANSGKGYCHKGAPEDDRHLRNCVLRACLGEILDKLWPMTKISLAGKDISISSWEDERHAVLTLILHNIEASPLAKYDPKLSIQYRFRGVLKHRRDGIPSFTSLGLFLDDVERLLRDLYGDIDDRGVMDDARWVVYAIVEEFMKVARPAVWAEQRNAEDMVSPKIWEDVTVNGEACVKAMKAAFEMDKHVREVRANPDAFCQYTQEFARLYASRLEGEAPDPNRKLGTSSGRDPAVDSASP